MEIKKIINQRFLEFLILILFLVMPFTNVNHVCIYIILELICLYGVVNYSKQKYDATFIKYFAIYFIWCTIVTILSVNFKLSFKSLTSLIIPPLLLFSLSDSEVINKNIHRYIFILSIIMVFLAIGIRANHSSALAGNYLFADIDKVGGGRLTTSTLSLCLIVYTMFFNQNVLYKKIIILLNLIAGFLLNDNAFYFVLFIYGFVYYVLLKSKISIYKVLPVIAAIIIILKFILINLLHHNLHICERLHIYSYWIGNIFYSPIYGVGLGLNLESLFYPTKFPIPAEIYKLDPHIVLHAHNCLLNLVLQTGFIGLALFITFLYKITRLSYQRDKKYGFAVFFMIFVIIMKNMVDDEFNGSRGLIFWFFIVLTYATVLNLSKNKLE